MSGAVKREGRVDARYWGNRIREQKEANERASDVKEGCDTKLVKLHVEWMEIQESYWEYSVEL